MNLATATSAHDPGMNMALSSPIPSSTGRVSKFVFRATRCLPVAGFIASLLPCMLGLSLLWFSGLPVQAQWITQINSLKPGWNAVYLHVDPDHASLSDPSIAGLSGPIEEIWHWNPPEIAEQITTPQSGEQPSQWTRWHRTNGLTNLKLTGNGAYLVRMNNSVTSYSWPVKGKPVTPTYRWTLTGLNFVGFPTPPGAPPSFASFFQPAPELLTDATSLFRYQGGEFGPTNPMAISPFLAPITPVKRDQAYWARAGEAYNQYFGPFQILGSGSSGIRFGAQGGQARFRLRNLVTNTITVTFTVVPSETNPTNNRSNPLLPPLLLRGPINPVDLTYTHTNLTAAPQQWTLAGKGQVGSEVEVTLGLNRLAMTAGAGTLYAAILRLTDSLGFSQVDMAVSAEKESTAGLWVGGAEVTRVNHYLTTYARATNGNAFTNLLISQNRAVLSDGVLQPLNGYRYEWAPESGLILVFGGPNTNRGSYLVQSNKFDGGSVPTPFPLRLIVHDSGPSKKFLQQVYHGPDSTLTNLILTTVEGRLASSKLNEARRISAVHLPLGTVQDMPGAMTPGSSLTTTVSMNENGASNPFLHAYHPDHDNLDTDFKSAPKKGNEESYQVDRHITLNFAASRDDFNSLTQGAQSLTGSYLEVMAVKAGSNQALTNIVGGVFALKRISDISTLTE